MKKIMDDNQKLVEKAVNILLEKLGPVEASRFLAMHQAGKQQTKHTPACLAHPVQPSVTSSLMD